MIEAEEMYQRALRMVIFVANVMTTTGTAHYLEVDTKIRKLSILSCGQYLRAKSGIFTIRSLFSDTGLLISAFLVAQVGFSFKHIMLSQLVVSYLEEFLRT